ncbi:hypothetical protein GOB02_30475 [Sinorhizobium meliloti]|nr:hypothetical protein [Sinorhizobium meliloti]
MGGVAPAATSREPLHGERPAGSRFQLCGLPTTSLGIGEGQAACRLPHKGRGIAFSK